MAGWLDTVRDKADSVKDIIMAPGNAVLDAVAPERKMARAYGDSNKRVGGIEDSLNAWFEDTYNRDFMDSTQMEAIVNLLSQKQQEDKQSIESKAAMTGATNEATLAANADLVKQFGNTMADMAKYGTTYKDNLYMDHFNKILGLEEIKRGNQIGATKTIVEGQQRAADNLQQFITNQGESAANAAKLMV